MKAAVSRAGNAFSKTMVHSCRVAAHFDRTGVTQCTAAYIGRGGSDDVAAGTPLRVADAISSSRMLGAVASNASGTPGMWQEPPRPLGRMSERLRPKTPHGVPSSIFPEAPRCHQVNGTAVY
jgi:hypothetical protein